MDIPKKKFSGYITLLSESWSTIWKRPISIFPQTYTVLAYLFFIVGFSGVLVLIFGTEINAEFIHYNLLGLAVLVIMVFFFFLQAHLSAISAVMYNSLAKKQSISLQKVFVQAKKLYWRALKLQLVTSVIYIPIAVLVALILIQVNQIDLSAEIPSPPPFLPVLIIIFLLSIVFIEMWLLFTQMTLVNTKLGAWKNIQKNWQLFITDALHVWSTFWLQAGISILVSIILMIIVLPVQETSYQWIGEVLNVIVSIFLSVWTSLFVYGAYLKRYIKKGRAHV